MIDVFQRLKQQSAPIYEENGDEWVSREDIILYCGDTIHSYIVMQSPEYRDTGKLTRTEQQRILENPRYIV